MTAQQAGHRAPLSLTWKWGLRLASLITLLVLWEAAGRSLPGLLMPTASETLSALVRLLGGGELWRAMWISNQALLIGYLAAVVVGVPLGLMMGRWPRVERPADLYLNLLLVIPVSALIPILIMALGLGVAARAAVVFTFAFAIVAVNTRAGLRRLDPKLIEMARAFGASEIQLWAKVLLPGARPGLLAGARLGLARAISGMVAVELLLVSVGFGRLLLRSQADFDAGGVYSVVLVVAAQAVLLTGWLRRRERRAEEGGIE